MVSERLDFARTLAEKAGVLALDYFRRLDTLTVMSKGHQDMVSEADRDVETLVRDEIAKAYPEDGILGEEHGLEEGTSGYTWVIDPIDGTANFVTAIPQWCVIIACVKGDRTVVGVIHDPCAGETFAASLGGGATLNGGPISASPTTSLNVGSVGVGFNGRSVLEDVVSCIRLLINEGGVFFRNASGGLMLAYAASGRLIGYVEAHMNAWDCLAGMLIATEAGNVIEPIDAADALSNGARIVVGAPGVFGDLKRIADTSFSS